MLPLPAVNAPFLTADIRHYLPFVVPEFLRVLGAVAILAAGFWLSGRAEFIVTRMLGRTWHFDEMLRGFFGNLARYFILTITGLTVLSQFGVQTTSLVAVIGAASLAIGLALQGTLSNLAAGVMLLIFRPFRLGHHIVVGGNDGNVKELTLFWTEVVTPDNVQIIIPNSSVWGQALKNLSTYEAPPVTVEVRFPVAGTQQLGRMRDRIRSIVGASPDIAATPAPTVLLDRSATDNALQFVVKFAPGEAGADIVKSEIIEAVQGAMDMQPAE